MTIVVASFSFASKFKQKPSRQGKYFPFSFLILLYEKFFMESQSSDSAFLDHDSFSHVSCGRRKLYPPTTLIPQWPNPCKPSIHLTQLPGWSAGGERGWSGKKTVAISYSPISKVNFLPLFLLKCFVDLSEILATVCEEVAQTLKAIYFRIQYLILKLARRHTIMKKTHWQRQIHLIRFDIDFLTTTN